VIRGHARRYRQGSPLSVLDGVPYVVIDGLDALPYPTTAGTTFVRCHVFDNVQFIVHLLFYCWG
jgi:hypothetical protein